MKRRKNNMLNRESSDKEILDYQLAGTSIRDIGTISFLSWVLNKINGVKAYSAATQEILGLAKNPPLGNILEGEKIKIVRKLIEARAEIL